jgi:hypothetical protein
MHGRSPRLQSQTLMHPETIRVVVPTGANSMLLRVPSLARHWMQLELELLIYLGPATGQRRMESNEKRVVRERRGHGFSGPEFPRENDFSVRRFDLNRRNRDRCPGRTLQSCTGSD